ncbi:hypothetical protein [Streptomyces sp. TRM49041]|uniref:hypothetical protein n=1 Tax=Streptomyces sp. TRM49041 TaxID=2603216 RepID=UPI0011EDC15B|nr:hypothetical protein [Streptomyces sp. TRM49041]
MTGACGGGGQEGTREAAPAASAAVAVSPEAAPSHGEAVAAELEKLALAQGDVKGHTVEKVDTWHEVTVESVAVDKAACEAFGDAIAGAAVGRPAATAQRMVEAELTKALTDEELLELPDDQIGQAMVSAISGTYTVVTIASYDGKGAEEALSTLRSAAKACVGGGFTMTSGVLRGGTHWHVEDVKEVAVPGKRDGLAWEVMTQSEPGAMENPFKAVVIRTGRLLAVFSSRNNFAGDQSDFAAPTAVIDAQLAKLPIT